MRIRLLISIKKRKWSVIHRFPLEFPFYRETGLAAPPVDLRVSYLHPSVQERPLLYLITTLSIKKIPRFSRSFLRLSYFLRCPPCAKNEKGVGKRQISAKHHDKSAVLFSVNISRSLKPIAHSLRPQPIALFTNPNRILPQLGPKHLFNEQNSLKRFNIHPAKQPVKPPSYTLPCHSKGLVNLLAIYPFKHHIAGPTRLQIHPQILRFHQFLQVLQKRLVLLG